MKVALVPAQVTSVEDRIIGNLSSAQTILLIGPLFFGGLLLALAPPYMALSLYKLVIGLGLISVGAILAIRFKGKLLGKWLLIYLKYYLRPKIYVYNKNVAECREIIKPGATKNSSPTVKPKPKLTPRYKPTPEIVLSTLGQWTYERNKKGVSYVRFEQDKS